MYIKLTTLNSDTYYIDESNLISWTYKADSSADNELMFGFASSCGLNFSIKDTTGTFTGVNFTNSTIELYEDSTMTTRKGIFKCNTIQRREDIINFESLDYMTRFDRRFTDETFVNKTIKELLLEACGACNVSPGSSLSSFLNDDIVIKDNETILNMNYRELIQCVCEVSGTFAYINQDGELEIGWYDLTPKKDISYSVLHSLEIQEEENNPKEISTVVNGVEVKTYQVSPQGYCFILSNNNPILMNLTEEECNNRLNIIKNTRFNNFKYYTLSCSLRQDWELNVGDSVRVEDRNGVKYLCLITNYTLQDYMMSITSSGQNYNKDYNQINNNNSNNGGGALLYRKHMTSNGLANIDIKNIKESSQAYINVSDTNLSGTIEILINDVSYKTITGNGLTSYGVILDLEKTMPTNNLKVRVNGVDDLEISLLLINCNVEETIPEHYYITRENMHDTILLRAEEIQGGE